MMPEKCPGCGAAMYPPRHYDKGPVYACGSIGPEPGVFLVGQDGNRIVLTRTGRCYERQLAQFEAENKRLKVSVEISLEWVMDYMLPERGSAEHWNAALDAATTNRMNAEAAEKGGG